MAANLCKSLFVLCAIINVFASNEVVAQELDVDMIASAMAVENLIGSLSALEAVIADCNERRRVIDIPHGDSISVSRSDLLLGIAYFNIRNNNRCMDNAAKEVLLAARVLERNPAINSNNIDAGFELIDTLVEEWWRELQAEARYHSLVSETNRIIIESIPYLDEPFDMVKSWNASEN